ncbi:MAG: FlgD immunoglobulin-like domain containing protein [Armatimonadota bacterium]
MRFGYRLLLCVVLTWLMAASAFARDGYVVDRVWGSAGTGDGQFRGNIGLSIHGDRLYTAECDNYRVQIFDLDGNFISKFGSIGDSTGQFRAPRQVVVDSLLNMFIVDSENNRVSWYKPGGVPWLNWGSQGSGAQNFSVPWRIAINRQTNMLYIGDMLNKRISQWTTGGMFIRTFGEPGTSTQYPQDLTVDAAGNVHVADAVGHRIQKFSADGVLQSEFSVGPGGNGSPGAVAPGPGSTLFVSDGGYSRIRKYTSAGLQIREFGSYGTGIGQFNWVDSIAVDDTGRVYVSDGSAANSRIQRFVYNNWPTAPTVVAINPKPARDGDNLVAKPLGATDADSDPLTYRYQWFRSTNNANWFKGPARRVLTASNTSVGEYWRVRVVAFDGKSVSPAKVSGTIRIAANLAPAMTATAQSTANGVGLTLSLAAAADVQVTVSNIAGRQIAVLPTSAVPAGVSTLHWNRLTSTGTKAAGGRYLLRATAKSSDGSQSSASCWVNLR